MPWTPLPITGPPYQNLADERELDVRSAQVVDAYIDEAGYTVKRPGLQDFVDVATAASIDGLYWWDEQGIMLVVSNKSVFYIADSVGTMVAIGNNITQLATGNRVSFATSPNGSEVLLASGADIVQANPSSFVVLTALDADAPTTVRSLTVHDQYAIAQVEGSGSFQFSEVGDVTKWRAQDVATAEGKPDRLVAVLGTLDGFVLFGKTSTEFWVNDGVSPFSRVRGLTLNRGCGARYSPALYGDTWLWLDEHRKVVRATVNSNKEVSGSISLALQGLSSVEDGLGDVMTVQGRAWYVLTFPLANRTFVYDIDQDAWIAEWGQWNTGTGVYDRFRGNCYAYSPKWNFHLVGDRTNGRIYKLTKNVFTDSGAVLRSIRRTGFITHETGNLKKCKALRLRLKRGVATGGVPNPTMTVRWREQGGSWSPSFQFNMSLGAVGEHDVYVIKKQCGTYRARQYEFAHSDDTDWILMSGEEDVEVKDR